MCSINNHWLALTWLAWPLQIPVSDLTYRVPSAPSDAWVNTESHWISGCWHVRFRAFIKAPWANQRPNEVVLNWIKTCKQHWCSFDSEPARYQNVDHAGRRTRTPPVLDRLKSKVQDTRWVDFKSFSLYIQRRLGEQHLFTKSADRRPLVWHYQLSV